MHSFCAGLPWRKLIQCAMYVMEVFQVMVLRTCLLMRGRRLWDPPSFLSVGSGLLSLGVKRPGRGVEHLPPTSGPVWLRGVDSENFNFLWTQRLFEWRICVRYMPYDNFFMVTPGLLCGIYLQQLFAAIYVSPIFAVQCCYIVSKIQVQWCYI
jgi:hypothetical protein